MRITARLAVVALTLLLALPASAQSIDALKAAGVVGERPDGLVALVKPAEPAVQELIDTINARRMAEYQEIARRNGTPVEAVQAIVGEKLVTQSPPGTWVMDAQGGWRVK
ncbi:MAG: YdbL family protein [Alphaproteobacteria bacterium]|nr:YdbL family protein [Alphaproteobacteria bacterium]